MYLADKEKDRQHYPDEEHLRLLTTDAHSFQEVKSDKAEYFAQVTVSHINNRTEKSSDESFIDSEDKDSHAIIIKKDQPESLQDVNKGFIFSIIFGISTGINYITTRMALERFDIKIHQLILPESFMLCACAFVFGTLNGVRFQDPYDNRRIYSWYSYSWPGNPYIHQMIIHRSMMSLISYILCIYSVATLPVPLLAPLILLLPFLIGIISMLMMPEETMSRS